MVERVATQELIDRLNALEAAIPVYVQALEQIADAHNSGPWGRIAERALRDAPRRQREPQ